VRYRSASRSDNNAQRITLAAPIFVMEPSHCLWCTVGVSDYRDCRPRLMTPHVTSRCTLSSWHTSQVPFQTSATRVIALSSPSQCLWCCSITDGWCILPVVRIGPLALRLVHGCLVEIRCCYQMSVVCPSTTHHWPSSSFTSVLYTKMQTVPKLVKRFAY